MKSKDKPDLMSFSDASKRYKIPVHQLYYNKKDIEALAGMGFKLHTFGKVNLLEKI